METIFVTGGTGLIGSNICAQLLERGDRVKTLARKGSDVGPLEALGCDIVYGDITDGDSVRAASAGCTAIVHSAAVLGGVTQDMSEHTRVNISGVGHVFEAAVTHGMRKVVTLGTTTTYFYFKTEPLTERSPIDPFASSDPYTQSKRAAYLEARRRAVSGLDVSIVIPGGTFGPAPAVKRAMEAPSFNLRLLMALRGELPQTTGFPIPWVAASDVAAASVAVLDRGVRGETYLAFGPPTDVCSMATFLNQGCELAGVAHRVLDITKEVLDADPELRAKVGPSMVALANQQFPQPFFDNRRTVERLGYAPQPLTESLPATLEWLREHHWPEGRK